MATQNHTVLEDKDASNADNRTTMVRNAANLKRQRQFAPCAQVLTPQTTRDVVYTRKYKQKDFQSFVKKHLTRLTPPI